MIEALQKIAKNELLAKVLPLLRRRTPLQNTEKSVHDRSAKGSLVFSVLPAWATGPAGRRLPGDIRTHQDSLEITIRNRQLILVSREKSVKKGIIVSGLFVSGGRNAERGMIALRVQDPTARHEEASK